MKTKSVIILSCLIYINRLSDFLFVLARRVNLDSGKEEVLWIQE